MTAADIGDLGAGLELGHHTVHGRQPRGGEVGLVPGAEELLHAVEHAVMVLAPRDAAVAAECVEQLVEIDEARRHDVRAGSDEDGGVLVGERHGLLRRKAIGAVHRLEVAGGGVGVEPLAHQPGIAAAARAASASAVSG